MQNFNLVNSFSLLQTRQGENTVLGTLITKAVLWLEMTLS